jgi:hypothetical protein
MSGSIEEFSSAQFDEATANLRQRRRQVVNRIVGSLTEILEIAAFRSPDQSPPPIVELIAEIQSLTARLADADDATFSEVVQDAASLLQSLERCRRELAEQATASPPAKIVTRERTAICSD